MMGDDDHKEVAIKQVTKRCACSIDFSENDVYGTGSEAHPCQGGGSNHSSSRPSTSKIKSKEKIEGENEDPTAARFNRNEVISYHQTWAFWNVPFLRPMLPLFTRLD